MRLEGKVAVVTGAGSGMGKAMAERFAAEGAMVVCAGRSASHEPVAEALGAAGLAVRCDVADEDQVKRLIAVSEARFGRIDIMVNNAGFGGVMAPLHEQTTEEWDRVHSVNLRGVFLCMKHAIAAMLRSGGGTVVNVSSATGIVGWKGHATYSAAKAGVHQLTKAAALDYGRDGIRVNCIAPGTVWTGLVPGSAAHAEPPPGTPRVPGIALDRWGLAREIADCAVFLASDESSYMTGAIVPVDGGISIGYSAMGAEVPGR
jgi:NAD(P)-dependent dehydrogenase (short-subunit alcohol dehydrogenase family)